MNFIYNGIDPKVIVFYYEPNVNYDTNMEKDRENMIHAHLQGDGTQNDLVDKNNTTIGDDRCGKENIGCGLLYNNLEEASSSYKGVNIKEGEFLMNLAEINVDHFMKVREVGNIPNFPTFYCEGSHGDYKEPFQRVSHKKGKNKIYKDSVSTSRCSQSKAPSN